MSADLLLAAVGVVAAVALPYVRTLRRLVDLLTPPSGLPAHTLSVSLVPCCDLRCLPHAVCATDHHGPERERYNRRVWGTEEPYRLASDEEALAKRLRGELA